MQRQPSVQTVTRSYEKNLEWIPTPQEQTNGFSPNHRKQGMVCRCLINEAPDHPPPVPYSTQFPSLWFWGSPQFTSSIFLLLLWKRGTRALQPKCGCQRTTLWNPRSLPALWNCVVKEKFTPSHGNIEFFLLSFVYNHAYAGRLWPARRCPETHIKVEGRTVVA